MKSIPFLVVCNDSEDGDDHVGMPKIETLSTSKEVSVAGIFKTCEVGSLFCMLSLNVRKYHKAFQISKAI